VGGHGGEAAMSRGRHGRTWGWSSGD
jgi:hypothetical protein